MSHYDSERFENLYNSKAYASNTDNWEDAVSKYRANAFYEALSVANLTESVQSIIDVGCGSGGVLQQLQMKFGHRIGEVM